MIAQNQSGIALVAALLVPLLTTIDDAFVVFQSERSDTFGAISVLVDAAVFLLLTLALRIEVVSFTAAHAGS